VRPGSRGLWRRVGVQLALPWQGVYETNGTAYLEGRVDGLMLEDVSAIP